MSTSNVVEPSKRNGWGLHPMYYGKFIKAQPSHPSFLWDPREGEVGKSCHLLSHPHWVLHLNQHQMASAKFLFLVSAFEPHILQFLKLY